MEILQQILSTLTTLFMALSVQIYSLPPSSQLAQVYQTPTFVQGKASKVFSSSPVTATFDTNVTSGNIMAVSVVWDSTSIILNNITANCVSGSFSLLNNPTTYTTVLSGAQGYATVSNSGACTVSANFSAAPHLVRMLVHEISGIDTSNSLDGSSMQGQSNAGNNTDAVTSGGISTAQSGDYIFGTTFDSGSGITGVAGTGFNSRLALDGAQGYRSEDR